MGFTGSFFRIAALRRTFDGLQGQIASWGGAADGPVARCLTEVARRVGPENQPDLLAAQVSGPRCADELRELAARAGRFVFVEARTRETVAGYLRSRSAEGEELATHQQLLSACTAAGLMPARYIPVGEFSDRVYMLCEKPGAAPEPLLPVTRPRARPGLAAIAMAAIIAAYMAGIGARGFWGENEAFYSLGARSVLEGHLLLPEQYHGMSVDKPPFAFWWIALVSAVLGDVNELTARVANLIPAMGTLALVIALGRRWVDTRAGVLGAVILATSYEFWENALEVNTDMILLFCLTGSWTAMLSILENGRRRGTWWALWGLMAVATLTKGPVAPLLSAIVAVTYAISSHGPREGWKRLMQLRPFLGSFACLAPVLLWSALVLLVHGPEPLRVIFLQHNVERFTNAFDHQRPWHYFFLELPISYLPWSLAIPFMIANTVRRMRAGDGLKPVGRFSWVVIATVFVFFSSSSSKRDYYILPLMPWLTLLTARTLWEWASAPLARKRGLLLARVSGALLVAMAVFALAVRPLLDARKSVKSMAREIAETVDRNDRLILFDQKDPRLYFYLERDFEVVDEDRMGDLAGMLRDGTELDIVARESEIDNLLAGEGSRLYLERVTSYKDRPFLVVTTQAAPELPELISSRVRRPTGIAWHPERKSLFIATKLGEIAEVTLEGRRIHSRAAGLGALEAVAIGPDGAVYVGSEREPAINVFDAETLQSIGRHLVELPNTDGEIEGLCALEDDGTFAIAVEGEPCLLLTVRFERGKEQAEVISSSPLPVDDFEGLQARKGGGYLLVSREDDRLLVLDDRGNSAAEPIDLPGFEQESVAIADDLLVICEESGWLAIWHAHQVLGGGARSTDAAPAQGH